MLGSNTHFSSVNKGFFFFFMKQRLYSFHEVTVREERFGEQSLAGILVGTFVTRVVLKPQNVYIEMACQ